MTFKTDVLACLSPQTVEAPVYVPDLTRWYTWNHTWGTLPRQWKTYSLPQVARAMGVPIWMPIRPWRVETPGVKIVTVERGGERVTRFETSAGVLIARWSLGEDDEWWQVEYPIKREEDLPAALELVRSRTYILDLSQLTVSRAEVGQDGILALELPRRPYSDLLHDFLGWGKGLLMLSAPEVQEMLDALEEKLRRLVQEVATLQGHVILAPDNLDGQFISPKAFAKHLADSYAHTTETLHAHEKRLVVHVGGPIRHLLEPLARQGVDALEGICGPPQSDATLAQARAITGPDVTLWGGIAQDLLLDPHTDRELEAAVAQAVKEARGDGRMILGVADQVPVEAQVERLETLPRLIARAA
jgi:hypothetical protein